VDKRRTPVPKIEVGNYIFILTKFIKSTQSTKKLSEKYLGPFKAIGKPGTYSYLIKLPNHLLLMGIKRFDHKTKVKARSERRNLQTASQLCTKQVGTGEINQIIESLLKVEVQRITKTY